MPTVIDLLDDAVGRYGPRPALAERGDDGSAETWTYDELGRRSRLAAWRLRALGLEPRIAGWRLWPEDDFPRTHTLKVRRDVVRRWATTEAPLPVQGD